MEDPTTMDGGVTSNETEINVSRTSDADESPIPLTPNGGGSPLREVRVIRKQLPQATAAAEAALAAYNNPPSLFAHGDELVKVNQQAAGPVLLPMNAAEFQCELAYAAYWTEQSERGIEPIYPPKLVVTDLLRRRGHWAPPLRDVTRVPVFGSGWNLIMEPGYRAPDQLFYHPDHPPLLAVSPVPSAADVASARTLLCEGLLGEFPFATPCHRAAAVAAMIVPFVRHRIDGATPLHLIESPQPGTGKTLLADVVAIPALGKEPPANTEISGGDELRKLITSMALAGQAVVLIDNINARLGGSALAAALTKVQWSDRILGSSRLASGSIRCLWLATGNNVRTTSELSRRIIRCRLDAGLQQPFLRSGFRHGDLRGWAKTHRADLIHAIVTLVQHWVASGRPPGSNVLGSYESYCQIIGGILHSAGIGGFLTDFDTEQRNGDDEILEWEAFVTAWHERFGESQVTSGELEQTLLDPCPEMLQSILGSANSVRGRRIKLGQELRKRRDSVAGRWRVRVSDGVDRHGCWSYRLEASDRPRQADRPG